MIGADRDRGGDGPRFDGDLRLTAVDDGHTRVALALTADPAGFLAALGDLIRLSPTSTATLDLQLLAAAITGAPA